MKKNFSLLLTLTLSIILFTNVYTDAVCTEKILIAELIQDIKDNGRLDCLRNPLPARKDKTESELETKRRLEAAWDTGFNKYIIINIFRLCI
jgi:hypothetical protein